MSRWSDALAFLRSIPTDVSSSALLLGENLPRTEDLWLSFGRADYRNTFDATPDATGWHRIVERHRGWGRFAFVRSTELGTWRSEVGSERATVGDDEGAPQTVHFPAHEYGVRLLLFRGPAGCGKSGGLGDAWFSCGLLVDIDAEEHRVRRPGERPEWWPEACPYYVETITDALAATREVLEPTWAFNTWGGVVSTYLYAEPVYLHVYGVAGRVHGGSADYRKLARKFANAFKRHVGDLGYNANSPPAATSWIRLPGSSTDYGRRVEVLVAEGPRYSIEELAAVAAPHPDTADHRYGPSTWDGQPIPRPRRGEESWLPAHDESWLPHSTWNPEES